MTGRPAIVVVAVLVFIATALVANVAFQVWQRAPEIVVNFDSLRELVDETPTSSRTAARATATAARVTGTGTVRPTASGSRAIPSTKPGDPVGQQIPGQGQAHVSANTRVTTYNSVPPTSGPHWPTTASWGSYTASPADEQLVHNLEHGGIVISHNTTQDVVDKLRALRASYGPDRFGSVKIVVRPYELIPRGQIALTAWTWIDVLEAYDETRIRAFITAHMNQCCEDVP